MMSSLNFGSKFEEIWPKPEEALNYTDFGKNLLEKCRDVVKPPNISVSDVNDRSAKFPIQFPINSCRIISQSKSRYENIETQINSAYPLIHERVLWLYSKFLEHKISYGTLVEKEVYNNLSLIDFIDRLLLKRNVSFIGKYDSFLLLSGVEGTGGFEKIGTDEETSPLVLKDCLSYDEIKLSALLSVTSHSEFLNNGSRNNCGKIDQNPSKIELSGVVIGIIGARLTKAYQMEFQDIVINKNQNNIQNGYGSEKPDGKNLILSKNWDYRQVWREFYSDNSKLFENIKKDDKRFGDSRYPNDVFDNVVMKRRYTISFDTLLLESEARANQSGKKAYIHVVGIGLGVWKFAQQQEKIFLETFSQRLKVLGSKLKHVSSVHFSWFQLPAWKDITNGGFFKIENHPDGGIKIFISKRNPADKLIGPETENCILIVSYAWDGNALPGNEFWMGMLSSTGDSSTACSTLITEIHNPHINPKSCGNNLHIASDKYGVLHISDYVKKYITNLN